MGVFARHLWTSGRPFELSKLSATSFHKFLAARLQNSKQSINKASHHSSGHYRLFGCFKEFPKDSTSSSLCTFSTSSYSTSTCWHKPV